MSDTTKTRDRITSVRFTASEETLISTVAAATGMEKSVLIRRASVELARAAARRLDLQDVADRWVEETESNLEAALSGGGA